jgi:chemotaxis protein MotB
VSLGEQTIIIKKVKKVQGGGHHGGAWKVAYADFVTAMMAFFLLMSGATHEVSFRLSSEVMR